MNQTGVLGSPAKRCEGNSFSFECCAFRVTKKIRIRIPFLKWTAGYLVIAVVLLVIEITAGHSKWNAWSYALWGYLTAWVAVSIIGLVKGWFY